jgi:DNA primase
MVKINDAIGQHILSDTVFTVNQIKDMFNTWQPSTNLVCPFHDDSNASLSITPEGKAYCFGCGFRATNVIELFGKVYDLSYLDARSMLYEKLVHAIPDHKVRSYCQAMTPTLTKWLKDKRHISRETVEIYQIGWDAYTRRYTIPILDQFGTCVNIRKYSPDQDIKMINTRGYGAFRLYPEEVLMDTYNTNILLVEGEFDALVGNDNGIATVTGTGGAGNWDGRYNWMFQNKNVFILYDNDDVGQAGAEARMRELMGVAAYVTLLDPPSKRGKDLSDWHNRTLQVREQMADMLVAKATIKMNCMSCNAKVKKVTTVTPQSGLHPMDVCTKCKNVLLKLKWEVMT